MWFVSQYRFSRRPSCKRQTVYQLQLKGLCMGQWKSDLAPRQTRDTIQYSQPGLWAGKANRPKHGWQCVRQPSSAYCFVWQLPGKQLLSGRAAYGHPERSGHGRFVADSCDDRQVQEEKIACHSEKANFAEFWEVQTEAKLGGEIVARCIWRQSCYRVELWTVKGSRPGDLREHKFPQPLPLTLF